MNNVQVVIAMNINKNFLIMPNVEGYLNLHTLYAPVSKTTPQRIKATLQIQRLKCAELEKQLNDKRCEIEKSSISIDNGLSKDITTFLSNSSENIIPFMNLFW